MTLWHWRYDQGRVRREEQELFTATGFDRERATDELNCHLQAMALPPYERCGDIASVHWVLFACLPQRYRIERVLEIGTYDGQTTALLARLFPRAEIITVDLPPNDPILRSTYGRTDPVRLEEYERRLASNTKVANVTLLRGNSFFLPSLVFGKFDLVWVDGGHLYPEVAWDLCNAYHLVRPSGVLMCDDVIRNPHGVRDAYVSPDSHAVLKYITERTNESLYLFLKRESAEWSANPRERKFVALLRKGGSPQHGATNPK